MLLYCTSTRVFWEEFERDLVNMSDLLDLLDRLDLLEWFEPTDAMDANDEAECSEALSAPLLTGVTLTAGLDVVRLCPRPRGGDGADFTDLSPLLWLCHTTIAARHNNNSSKTQ